MSVNKLGDVLVQVGDLLGALARFEASLKVTSTQFPAMSQSLEGGGAL